MQNNRTIKIGVGLSGGVDSAAAALLLLESGYEVTGFTLMLDGNGARTAEGGAAVAAKLGIPHAVTDLRKEFDELILKRFVNDYAQGLTPSPCVVCNACFKFGAMWDVMAAHGCEGMATGHYAVIREADGFYELHRGADGRKDQSYFLAQLTQQQLSRAVFPLGNCHKEDIRQRVLSLGIVPPAERESQDLCFLPDGNYGDFVLARRPELGRRGAIVDASGKTLGTHEGAFRYTVGQRRGLGLGGGPWFVLRTDMARNEVVIGHQEELDCQSVSLHGMNWLSLPCDEMETMVQIRYLMRPRRAVWRSLGDGRGSLTFLEKMDAVPPGQLAVAYDGDRVLASAWIEAKQA